MADDSNYYSGDYVIYWATEKPPYEGDYGDRPEAGEQTAFDIRITDGGVLHLRPKEGDDHVLCFPPHSYRWVAFRNVSAANSG